MLQIHNPLETDFEKIDVDPFWNVGNEVEHLNHKIHSYPAKFPAFITQKAIQYTQEYILSDAVDYIVHRSDPMKIRIRTERLDRINAAQEKDPAMRIMYAAINAGISNAWKKWLQSQTTWMSISFI